MHGWEFARRRTTDPSITSIPAVVLSDAILPPGTQQQLAKPVGVDRLLALADQYC
jgi:hypothetical protein